MKQNRLAVFLSLQFTSKMNGNCTVSLGKGSIYGGILSSTWMQGQPSKKEGRNSDTAPTSQQAGINNPVSWRFIEINSEKHP